MKPSLVLLGSIALAFSLGAAAQTPAGEPVPGTDGLITSPEAALAERVFVSSLSGQREVPPRESEARGAIAVRLDPGGQSLSYRLSVRDIENVSAAHLHLGLPGENGPIIVPLLGQGAPGDAANPPSGPAEGVIAEGEFSAADFTGPLAGVPLAVFMELIRSGAVYANVHTSQFPDGEIRGSLRGLGVGTGDLGELLELDDDVAASGEIGPGADQQAGIPIGGTNGGTGGFGGLGMEDDAIEPVEGIGSVDTVGPVEGVGNVDTVGPVEGVGTVGTLGPVEPVGEPVDPLDSGAAGGGSAGGTDQTPAAPGAVRIR